MGTVRSKIMWSAQLGKSGLNVGHPSYFSTHIPPMQKLDTGDVRVMSICKCPHYMGTPHYFTPGPVYNLDESDSSQ